ncbi:MAG: hypothetical protein CV087_16660 [Candidatus Brocadia sp. WS118]|nr:MAG: hypothetical protein CV087_16660 [Candidatus Brocadia sp. WS118]
MLSGTSQKLANEKYICKPLLSPPMFRRKKQGTPVAAKNAATGVLIIWWFNKTRLVSIEI